MCRVHDGPANAAEVILGRATTVDRSRPLSESPMQDLKKNSFQDRAAASAAAKQALLAKFKPKPTITAPALDDRTLVREADLAAVRAARAEAKAAKEAARQAAEAAVVQVLQKAADDSDEARRAERKARKAAIKEAARAKRESNQAIRRTG